MKGGGRGGLCWNQKVQLFDTATSGVKIVISHTSFRQGLDRGFGLLEEFTVGKKLSWGKQMRGT